MEYISLQNLQPVIYHASVVFRHSQESTIISYQLQKRCIRFLHNLKISHNKIILTCYRNAVRSANTPIGHNIAFLRNTLGIGFDNNEITPDISLSKVYFTNEQRVLLSNLELLITVRKGNFTLTYLSSYYVIISLRLLSLLLYVICTFIPLLCMKKKQLNPMLLNT